MDTTRIAQPEKRTTTRVRRGRELYAEHASEIRFEHGTWLIPSQGSGTSVYEVTLGRKGEFCECRDFEFRGETCKHVYAASVAQAKTATCSGCDRRFRHRDLSEVEEGHESLTWFVGDQLCDGCLHDHGGIA